MFVAFHGHRVEVDGVFGCLGCEFLKTRVWHLTVLSAMHHQHWTVIESTKGIQRTAYRRINTIFLFYDLTCNASKLLCGNHRQKRFATRLQEVLKT